MILVAAIAAGVILRTQSVLQQRALAVGNEVRERLITGVDLISITGLSNTSTETINKFEIILRLKAGSYDVDLRTMYITFGTKDFANQANLLSKDTLHYNRMNVTLLNTSQNFTTPWNLDYFVSPDAETTDEIKLLAGTDASDNKSELQFFMADGTNFKYPLGINFSDTTTLVNISGEPIFVNSSLLHSRVIGFLTIVGYPDGNNSLQHNTANWSDVFIETDINTCAWNKLVPDYRFCRYLTSGSTDNDYIVKSHELLTIRYLLSAEKALPESEEVNLKFLPKSGNFEEYIFSTPTVISKPVETVWP